MRVIWFYDQPVGMFYLVGIVLTFFLAVLLITKRGKSAADRILALWLVVIGLHLLFYFLIFTGRIFAYPYLLGINFPFPLLHGPFLFLYTSAVTNRLARAKYRLLHFVPFFLAYWVFAPFYLMPSAQKIFIFKNDGRGYESAMLLLLVSILISGIAYVAFSLWLLKKHKRIIKDQFSSAEKINLAWLRYLIYGIGIIWLLVLVGEDPLIFNGVVVFVFFLGYFGIKQVGIFAQEYPKAAQPVAYPEPSGLPDSDEADTVRSSGTLPLGKSTVKYQRSGLSEHVAKEVHNTLSERMKTDKLYTNPELTLAELAKALAVHPNNLSQVINTFEKKTFYDYINGLRVEEFKRLVTQPESQKYTLLALAHDCGFNSKTSFNRNFKSVTGLSPSEYLAHTRIQLSS